jgi:hypothetical protein
MLSRFRIIQFLLLAFIILAFPVNSRTQSRWVEQISGSTAQLNSVHFADSYTGIVCGYNGTLLRTTNGGYNWSNISFGSSSYYKVRFRNNQVAYLSAYTGYYKSSNGGLDWTLISNTGYYAQRIFLFDSVIIFVANRYFFESTDNGNTWFARETTDGGYDWSFIDQNTGWTISAQYYPPPNPNLNIYNRIHKTTDCGSTFSLLSTITSQSQPMYQTICFYDANTGYIAGLYGTRKTTNAGASWSVIQSNLSWNIFIQNRDTLYLSSVNPGLMRSTNAGLNWVNDSVNVRVNDLCFVDRFTGWLVGDGGKVFVTAGALIGIEGVSENSPGLFSLEQNYPNPFNPSTVIKFELPVSGFVRLAVYDVLGSRVDLLVNEYMEAGSHNISFDGSFLSAGVYFYRLETSSYSETRKMMLIK